MTLVEMSSEATKMIKPVVDITESAASELKGYLAKQGKPMAGLRQIQLAWILLRDVKAFTFRSRRHALTP